MVLKCIIFVLSTMGIPFLRGYQVLKKYAMYKRTIYTFRMNFCENSVKSNKYNTVIHLPENNSQKKYRQHYCSQFFGAKKISKRSYAPHLFTTERFHLRHSEKTGLSLKCHFQFSYLCNKNYYSSIFWWLWVRTTEAMFEYWSDSVFPKVLEIKGLPWLLHISDWNIQKTCPLIKYLWWQNHC